MLGGLLTTGLCSYSPICPGNAWAVTATSRPYKQPLSGQACQQLLAVLEQDGHTPASWPGPEGRMQSFLHGLELVPGSLTERTRTFASSLHPHLLFTLLSLNRIQAAPYPNLLFKELPLLFFFDSFLSQKIESTREETDVASL